MPGDVRQLEQFVYRRPHWCGEQITEDDARFLHDLVVDVRPDVAVEVGVASGSASVHILSAMATYRLRVAGDVWLHAFDIAERYSFEASKTTGAAVAELTPELRSHYRFTVGDMQMPRQTLTGLHAPFAFINTNQLRPWSGADLVGLLPVLGPGAWIALDDIRLSPLERWNGPSGHDAGYLFEQWPGEKRRRGIESNVGAVRLPDSLSQVAGWLTRTFLRNEERRTKN